MAQDFITLKQVVLRGLRQRCPRCGEGILFEKWATLKSYCEACGLSLAARQGDAWAFMYVSTAFITGLILSVMFFIEPRNLWLGRVVLLAIAILILLGSVPPRKGIAIGLDYWVEEHWNRTS